MAYTNANPLSYHSYPLSCSSASCHSLRKASSSGKAASNSSDANTCRSLCLTTSSFTRYSMIRAVVPLRRQSSTLRRGRLKAKLALSRSLRMGSKGSACLQFAYRYCFHLGLLSRTSLNSGSNFCFANLTQSASTFPFASRISKSQSLGNFPQRQAAISVSNSLISLLISLSGAILVTLSTSLAYSCRERKAGRFSTASRSLATLLFAISIFASSCLGKMLRVSLLRMDRQYASPCTYQRSMNYLNSDSYILSIYPDNVISLIVVMQKGESMYRAVSMQERQQLMEGSQSQGVEAQLEPLQLQKLSQQVESLLQEGISTDFLYERNKLMIFLLMLVILGFYLFFVVNFKAQISQTVRKPPSAANYTAEMKSPMRNKALLANQIGKGGKNSSIMPNTSKSSQEILNGLRKEQNETQIDIKIQKQLNTNQVQS